MIDPEEHESERTLDQRMSAALNAEKRLRAQARRQGYILASVYGHGLRVLIHVETKTAPLVTESLDEVGRFLAAH